MTVDIYLRDYKPVTISDVVRVGLLKHFDNNSGCYVRFMFFRRENGEVYEFRASSIVEMYIENLK